MFKITGYAGQHDESGAIITNGKITIHTPSQRKSWTEYAIINEFVLQALNAQEHTLPPNLQGAAS